MIRKTKYIVLPFILVAIVFIGATQDQASNRVEINLPSEEELAKRQPLPVSFAPVKDTIYVLGDEYIEICLKSQTAKLIKRNGETYEYKISSGNPYISKGMETTPGIFTVQSKSQKAISRQFDNAELFWWVGFNGNIGFHGLAGNGYYHHLGVRPSSHGCVRISREDGKDLYDRVKIGTPVMVYKNEPARVLAFADWDLFAKSSSTILITDNSELNKVFKKRLENLYSGKAYTKNKYRIFIDGATRLRNLRIDVGEFEKVSYMQEIPFEPNNLELILQDKLSKRNNLAYLIEKKTKEQEN